MYTERGKEERRKKGRKRGTREEKSKKYVYTYAKVSPQGQCCIVFTAFTFSPVLYTPDC
jgi:hypothetical protein